MLEGERRSIGAAHFCEEVLWVHRSGWFGVISADYIDRCGGLS